MGKNTAVKDELDSILDEVQAAEGDEPITSFDQEFAGELEAPDLGDYDLAGVSSLDLRPLRNRAWYGAEISAARSCLSKSGGNPQIEFILKVTEGSVKDEVDDQGASVVGVTVYVYAATPRVSPGGRLTPQQINSLWTIKDIAGAVGLADLGPDGKVKAVKKGTTPNDFLGRKLRFRNVVDEKYDLGNPRNKADAFAAARA